MILKLGVKHQGQKLYKVYINHDLGMTLTYFTARSTEAANAFEWEKMVKYYLISKTYWEYANGQKINIYGKILPLGVVCPCPGAIYM